ncbi:uncharacterized protein LOC129122504 [Agelaius phoeniceus]|uniref:uncharacterized protein LOC129122504 n=1 Tax=Agelaius phoeniceus TaxID=39638 RepID=UPI0040550A0E
MAGSHWAGTERCQRRTSVTRRLHRHPPPHAPLPPPRTGRRQAPPPPARAGAAPPLHRPPLSAPLARDNVTGGNRSFLTLARGKLHPALRRAAAAAAHPRRIPQDRERAGKTSGSREALGAASPLPGVPASLILGGPHPPLPGVPASLLLLGSCIPPFPGRLHPPFPGAPPPLPRGHSRFSRPGAAGGGGSAHPASQGLGVCKERGTDHGFLQALAQTLRSSASTPV